MGSVNLETKLSVTQSGITESIHNTTSSATSVGNSKTTSFSSCKDQSSDNCFITFIKTIWQCITSFFRFICCFGKKDEVSKLTEIEIFEKKRLSFIDKVVEKFEEYRKDLKSFIISIEVPSVNKDRKNFFINSSSSGCCDAKYLRKQLLTFLKTPDETVHFLFLGKAPEKNEVVIKLHKAPFPFIGKETNENEFILKLHEFPFSDSSKEIFSTEKFDLNEEEFKQELTKMIKQRVGFSDKEAEQTLTKMLSS